MDQAAASAKCANIGALRVDQAARIKALLFKAGFSLLGVDKHFNLPRGTAGDALRNPNLKGERAIAAALGTRPELLWRDRYHASGQRRSRQDYSRPPKMEQRRNGVSAQTGGR